MGTSVWVPLLVELAALLREALLLCVSVEECQYRAIAMLFTAFNVTVLGPKYLDKNLNIAQLLAGPRVVCTEKE